MSKKVALFLATVVALPLIAFLPARPVEAAFYPLCTKAVNHRNSAGQNISVPASSGGAKDCLIGNGLVGCAGSGCTAITRLQRTINVCYRIPRNLSPIKVDGYWGPQTRGALVQVQRWVKADDDGIYGPETKRKMRHESNDIPLKCHPY